MKRLLARLRAAVRRHLLLTVAAGAVLVAVAAVGAESAARTVIQHRVAQAAPGLGDDVSVGVGGDDWALWDLAHERIPRLDISSDAARVGTLSPLRVQARLDDVRLGAKATVGSTRAEVTVPPQAIADAIRTTRPGVPVASVSTDPENGTVLAAVGPGGAGQLTLRPALADGKVSLAVDGLTVFGRSVPADRFGPQAQAQAPRAYPLGLAATSVRVRADGLHVTLTGGPVPLPAG
ncbi:LmeA family phospholipid-binding protein [Streptomyces sp. NPDC059564]|uniref:LmeA family phospholipid-binding protein n=1 Tax=Streptomyces sp. NPDC059564 TaxID=3346865 RepID=UPI00367FE854